MRKQTKVAAVVSAAALLAIGASMTSFAARGWNVEDGEHYFLDSSEERVYGEWKRDGGYYFWLDEETGYVAKNRIVEDGDATYYVDANGARVTSDWVPVENVDGIQVGEEEPDTIYYYFGTNGKAYKAEPGSLVKKSIDNQTYFFDENGVMQYGWVSYEYVKNNETKTDYYYCGTDEQGWAYKGWYYAETEFMPTLNDGYEDEEWVYLDGGKLAISATKYIDKHYYSFDDSGILATYWHDPVGVATNGLASGAEAYAYNAGVAEGVLSSGWVEADVNEDGEFGWYYMVNFKDGNKTVRAIPFNQGGAHKAAKLIDGKTYLFDALTGKMLTGKQTITDADATGVKFKGSVASKELESGIYFFAKSSEGSLKKGQLRTGKVTDVVDGEEFNYYFDKDGKAYVNALKDNVIYGSDGVRVQAEDGNAYERITLTDVVAEGKVYDGKGTDPENIKINGGDVIVSATGKIRTSGTVRIDGEKLQIKFDETAKQYIITELD